MSKWFLPDNYKHLRMCVKEYIREFEQLKIKSGIEKEPEQTIARFLGGLKPPGIAEKVDIQPY